VFLFVIYIVSIVSRFEFVKVKRRGGGGWKVWVFLGGGAGRGGGLCKPYIFTI